MDIDKARGLFSAPVKEPEPNEVEAPEPDPDPVSAPHTLDKAVKMAIMLAEKRRKKYAMLSGGDSVLMFGRHSGKRVSALAVVPEGRDYLRWMLSQEFDKDLLEVVRRWLART